MPRRPAKKAAKKATAKQIQAKKRPTLATGKRRTLVGAAKITDEQRIAIEERRQQVIHLRTLGLSFAEIAQRLGISVSTAWDDKEAAIKRVAKKTDRATKEFKARETQKLLSQERELALAWVKSKDETGGLGDPRYLDARTKTLARLHKLNGLDDPEKSELDLKSDLLSLTVVTKKGGGGGTDAGAP